MLPEKPKKDLESLHFTAHPDRIQLGKDTTVQDLVDWIRYMFTEMQLKDIEIALLRAKVDNLETPHEVVHVDFQGTREQ